MRTITVKVTAKDIKNGHRGNGATCPVARAIRRHGFLEVEVGSCVAFLKGFTSNFYTNEKYKVRLPKKAETFIDRFDVKLSVSPFSFVMRLPDA